MLYSNVSDSVRGSEECAALWTLGDECGLLENTGEDGVFLLLRITLSVKGAGFDERVVELPLVLPPDSREELEVLEYPEN